MKFCEVCDNMMYMSADKEDPSRLYFSCKNCGNVLEGSRDATECVVDVNYVDDATLFQQYATPHIAHDPTLPHVDNIKCANVQCSKKPEDGNDVIYFKFDHVNMKYMYHCCYCKHFWYLKYTSTSNNNE
jgi:DNA-directed RNA polymerase subunit M/transcription elongation factor TFIIS